jgi:hypothetical protein
VPRHPDPPPVKRLGQILRLETATAVFTTITLWMEKNLLFAPCVTGSSNGPVIREEELGLVGVGKDGTEVGSYHYGRFLGWRGEL